MHSITNTKSICNSDEESDLRRGPWTLEEDNLLVNYVSCHGEGRWNLLAKCSGLKRTGKSCRLRWLNYLKPDVKRGNLSPEEQFKILELHSKWGNRWSKIAQHLPGRTDNEIKNYWRTRVQKQARQLKIDSNSESLLDSFPYFWMPTSLHNVDQEASSISYSTQNSTNPSPLPTQGPLSSSSPSPMFGVYHTNESFALPSGSGASPSPYDLQPPQLPEVFENPPSPYAFGGNMFYSPFLNSNYTVGSGSSYEVEENSPAASTAMAGLDSQMGEEDWAGGNDIEDSGSLWNMGEMWQFRRPE